MAKRVDSGAGGQGLWRDLQTGAAGSKKTHAGKKKSATKPQTTNFNKKKVA
jgi:hypothetical protein